MTFRALIIATCFVTLAAGSGLAQEPREEQAVAPRTNAEPGQRGRTPEAPRSATPAPPAALPASTAVPPERPRRDGQPINIKVDLTLTDQRAGAPPIKRTVTVLAADGYTGSIRTASQVALVGVVPLNVDASPTLLADGKMRVGINLQYDWPAPAEGSVTRGTVTSTALHDQLMLILENGKAMVVAQSADPVGDRQVTVEVKATILK
jgi:hypothetical protein